MLWQPYDNLMFGGRLEPQSSAEDGLGHLRLLSCLRLWLYTAELGGCSRRKALLDGVGHVAFAAVVLGGSVSDASEATTAHDNARMCLGTLFTSTFATNQVAGPGLLFCMDW